MRNIGSEQKLLSGGCLPRLLGLLCVLGVAVIGLAQSNTGRIQGTIADSSGAVVAGATVSVTNSDTARVITVQSGTRGEFSVPALNPGRYRIQVKAASFKAATQDITLEVGQVVPLTFTLAVGATSETLEVTSAPPVVDSASSDIGDVIIGRQVVNMPLNGRNFTQLATFAPGVNRGRNVNGAGNGADGSAESWRFSNTGDSVLSVNGLRPQANNFLIDGFDNNESLVNTLIFFPSPDAIQEFRVATNVAPAEFGRAGGAIINTATHSGTNQMHGSAFEYLRNSALDATPWSTDPKAKKFPFKQNQFGGNMGGPIIKEKLFLFGDYQGMRASQPNTTEYITVPTALMRSSGFRDFSELLPATKIYNPLTHTPFPSNIIPGSFALNPAAVNYLNAFPAPNCNSSINSSCHFLTQNYSVTRQKITTMDDFDVRSDWNIGPKDSSFFRYSYGKESLLTTSQFAKLPAGYGSAVNPTKPWSAVLEETRLFRPNVINEFRAGFIHTLYGYEPPMNDQPVSQNLGIVNANTNANGQVDPILGGGALIGGWNNQLNYTGDYGPYLIPQNTWQVSDGLSWVKGPHTLKFGADIMRRQVNLFRPLTGKGFFFLYGNGTTDGNPQTANGSNVPITGYEVTDLLAGFVHQYSVGPVLGYSETRNWEMGYFAQDDWRVTRRLTLNLGLRYDVLTWPVEKFDQQSNFNISTGHIELAGKNGNSRSFIPVEKDNWAPRVGFAYDLRGDGRSKISGAFGIFYFPDRGGISNQLAQNPPYSGQTTYDYANGYRFTLTGSAPMNSNNPQGATGPMPSKGIIQVDLNNPTNVSISVATLPNKTPRVQEWNLQYERELKSNMSVNLAYVGTRGTRLLTYYDYNRVKYNATQTSKNFPNLGSINTQATIGASNYNSFQASLNRHFSSGLQFQASYTWSHAIDDTTAAFDGASGPADYRNLAAERGNSLQDIRHRFIMNGLYQLPFGHGKAFGGNWNGFANAVLGGWQSNIIFTAQSGTPFDVTCGGNPSVRCDLVGDPYAGVMKPFQYFNKAAFAAVPSNASGITMRTGTTPRNYLTGPGIMDVDFSIFKNFKVTERVNTEFRAEFFNLTNTPQFVNPDSNYTDGNFGMITNTRLGGEREIQFALRFSF